LPSVIVLTQIILLEDDVTKFISDLPPPTQPEDVLEEGKVKMKERREVGEGDDTVTIEDTSDDEDGETLQERFQPRSRFSRPGLPTYPLSSRSQLVWKLAFPVPPRRPRNVPRKRAAKKLKITESTSQEVGTASSVVE
jgi:hypothetical protein